VHGAYLISAAVVQRGAGLIDEETCLSTITDMALAPENFGHRKVKNANTTDARKPDGNQFV
jgi:hypothetical protein